MGAFSEIFRGYINLKRISSKTIGPRFGWFVAISRAIERGNSTCSTNRERDWPPVSIEVVKFDQHSRLRSADGFAATHENIVFSSLYINLKKIRKNLVRFSELIERYCLNLNAVTIHLSTDGPIPGTGICERDRHRDHSRPGKDRHVYQFYI